jgi:hypothetical protein
VIHRLKRHPLPMTAYFRHSLVLTYAFPRELLDPFVPPGLELDTLGELGFAAVALVQTEALRPAGLPRALGRDFFLVGYRVFVRRGSLRGLRIVRSETDAALVVLVGNALTRYGWRRVEIDVRDEPPVYEVRTSSGVHVRADLRPAPLPVGSPFADAREARRFAGPLPYTFEHEPETGAIVAVRAVRAGWEPLPVRVDVRRNDFVDELGGGVLANAFHVAGVDYRWQRGRPL